MSDQQIIQSLVQELQIVRGQIQSLTSQMNEISLTVEALKTQSSDRAVYRALGAILLEVEDRDSLNNDLNESQKTIETHIARLNERESEIRAEYTKAVENLE